VDPSVPAFLDEPLAQGQEIFHIGEHGRDEPFPSTLITEIPGTVYAIGRP